MKRRRKGKAERKKREKRNERQGKKEMKKRKRRRRLENKEGYRKREGKKMRIKERKMETQEDKGEVMESDNNVKRRVKRERVMGLMCLCASGRKENVCVGVCECVLGC